MGATAMTDVNDNNSGAEKENASAAGGGAWRSPMGYFPRMMERLLNVVDPVGLGRASVRAMTRTAVRPGAVLGPTARFAGGVVQASVVTACRMVGVDVEGPMTPAEKDSRFADEAWSRNASFYGLRQLYLLGSRLASELVDAAPLPEPDASKAKFVTNLIVDAAAPTNYFFTNPKALRRAFDTGGQSLALGARNWLHDLSTNGGWPSQVKKGAFTVGKNMAVSKGRVVFRNDLIELIQYEPLTPRVHAVPIVFCPPWINKYYILDLSPGKSLVEWALQHHLTVFAISYRNPDSSMRDVAFEDYLFQGPRAAIDVARSITGAAKVNTLSVCVGGTLNAALVAYLEAKGQDLVNSSTYLNTLVDFAGAGTLSDVFTDDKTVEALVQQMEGRGYLEAGAMAHTFDLLRANDLVFRYVASNWLMGEDPPAFDILAWNADSTRMPAKMQAYYLRKCWIENALARDKLVLAGSRLKVSTITNDTYLVAGVTDHIVPWRSNYRTTQLLQGNRRFVLTPGGHIAGIINPPRPEAKFWANEEFPADPDQWLSGADEVRSTWWDDWAKWVRPRSGPLRLPPALGNAEYPAMEDAPGTYVRG
jgi:polyhydroxyalkanoate synthase